VYEHGPLSIEYQQLLILWPVPERIQGLVVTQSLQICRQYYQSPVTRQQVLDLSLTRFEAKWLNLLEEILVN
jgi:hypothetical protein